MNIAGTVPSSLFHSGRAQCPDCGAALDLVDHQPIVRCGYCGGSSVVERRLRMLEPNISGDFLTADAPPDQAKEIRPSHIINAVAQDESHCPTCGSELEPAQTQAIRQCPYCKTQSKVERRLRRSPDSDQELAKMEAEAQEYEKRQFAQTQALIEKVETSKDLATRVRAARELGDAWAHCNVRAARMLARVIEILRTSQPEIEIPLSELLGKLLCSNNVILSNAVLRAAEKYTFDTNGSRALLRALGLGSGVGLKLLLDTADYAAMNGATEYACTALWSVSTMIERNYSEHMRYADIALYRLLYLKGPVQAWAIQLAQGQMGLGCRFSTPTLLYFMDDCAVERPELIPYINECFYDGRAQNEGEYLIRFEFLDKLLTGPAKRALLEHLYSPPLDALDKKIGKCMERLLSLADDPRLGDAAVKCIADMIEEEDQPRRCIDKMVETHGDKLPEEIRLAYLQKVPKTPHLTPIVPKNRYVDSRQRNAFDDQIEQWKKMWDQGIRKAVDVYYERQRVASEYWAKIKSEPT